MAAKIKETKLEKEARLQLEKEAEAKRLREAADALKIEANRTDLLAALAVSRGFVASACRAVNLSRTTFYNYYNDDPQFADPPATVVVDKELPLTA